MALPVWVPYALMAAAAGTQAYANDKTARERDDIAAANIRRQSMHQRRVDDRVKQNLNELETSSPDADRAASLTSYLSQLRAARAAAGGTPNAAGTSARYQGDTETSDAAIQNYGKRMADSLSRINSAGLQRQRERIGTGRMATDVGGIVRQARGDDTIAQLEMNAVRNDPWLLGLSMALKAASMATGGGAASGGASSGASAAGSTAGGGSSVAGMGSGMSTFGAASRYVPLGY